MKVRQTAWLAPDFRQSAPSARQVCLGLIKRKGVGKFGVARGCGLFHTSVGDYIATNLLLAISFAEDQPFSQSGIGQLTFADV